MLGKTHKLYFDVVLNNFLIELDKRAETPELKKPNPLKNRVQGAAKDVDPPLNFNRATICPLFPGQVLFLAAYFSVRPVFFLIKECPGFCPVTTDDLAGGVPKEVTTPLTSRV